MKATEDRILDLSSRGDRRMAAPLFSTQESGQHLIKPSGVTPVESYPEAPFSAGRSIVQNLQNEPFDAIVVKLRRALRILTKYEK